MKLEDLKDKEIEVTEDGLLKVVEKKTEKFVPKVGEIYWYVRSNGDVDYYRFTNDKIDKYLLNHQPIFRTQTEAEEYKRYLDVLDKYKCEFTDAEWKDENIEKWHLCYYTESGAWSGYCAFTIKYPNCTYFKSQEDAKAFIKEAGEENVKKFMFDIWE